MNGAGHASRSLPHPIGEAAPPAQRLQRGSLLAVADDEAQRRGNFGQQEGGAVSRTADNPRLGPQDVAFLDDDRDKRGPRIYGLPVLGGLEIADDLLATQGVDEVIRLGEDSAGPGSPVGGGVHGPRCRGESRLALDRVNASATHDVTRKALP